MAADRIGTPAPFAAQAQKRKKPAVVRASAYTFGEFEFRKYYESIRRVN